MYNLLTRRSSLVLFFVLMAVGLAVLWFRCHQRQQPSGHPGSAPECAPVSRHGAAASERHPSNAATAGSNIDRTSVGSVVSAVSPLTSATNTQRVAPDQQPTASEWGQKAVSLLALEPTPCRIVSVSRQAASDTNIPFVGEAFSNRSLVVVEMKTEFVRVGRDGQTGAFDRVSFRFVEDTGQMLDVVIEKDGVGVLPWELPAKEVERFHKYEKYLGLPVVGPTVTVQRILGRLDDVCQVEKSKRITVLYVVTADENRGLPEAPRWIVKCTGLPPRPAMGFNRSPPEDRMHMRYVFESGGRLLRVNNRP